MHRGVAPGHQALRREAAREERLEHALGHEFGEEARLVVDGVLLRAVGVDELGAHDRHVGVRVEEAHAALQGVVTQDRVAVQQRDVAALGAAEPHVAAPREAAVPGELDHLGEREALAHEARRPVRRRVVHHERLAREAGRVRAPEHLALERGQAVGEHVPRVPAHDHDGEVGHARPPAACGTSQRSSAGSAAASTRSGAMRVMQRWSMGHSRR